MKPRRMRQIVGCVPREFGQSVGDWNGSDDVLIAWVEVTRREGMSYVVCLSVDIAGRIDKLDDLSLVVTTPSESACKGAKPRP